MAGGGGTTRRQPRLLTVREVEVLMHVAQGRKDRQIARVLGISEKTVRNHLSHVFTKLRVSNRTHAVIAAIASGIFDVE